MAIRYVDIEPDKKPKPEQKQEKAAPAKKEGFDRVAYQREYMRKWRQKRKRKQEGAL